ncbi:MAG: hypothetical protein HY275_01960 [Gemmatimonadetes bacterium]|nr:hypothetical protein [Gemmatimonadota bacterium]
MPLPNPLPTAMLTNGTLVSPGSDQFTSVPTARIVNVVEPDVEMAAPALSDTLRFQYQPNSPWMFASVSDPADVLLEIEPLSEKRLSPCSICARPRAGSTSARAIAKPSVDSGRNVRMAVPPGG